MPSFQDAITAGIESIRDAAGVEITYARNGSTVTLQAVPGQTTFNAVDKYGVTIKSKSRDYIVKAADLVIDNEELTPERGDRITEGAKVFQVLRPDGDGNVYRYSDSAMTGYRIHTKEVSS